MRPPVRAKEARCNDKGEKPEVTVVIITYNRAEMLRGALKSIIRQETDGEFSYEIVVVDNASTDSTKAVVQRVATNCSVPLRYIFEEDKGVAQARNRGIKETSSEWIAFFDDDQLAEPDWLKELLALASKTGTYCVRGSRVLCLSEQQLSRLLPTCRTLLGEKVLGNEPKKCHRKTLPNTGNVLIRRTIFDAVGYFDESLTWGGEDLDFFRRVRLTGFEAWCAPKAVVHHLIPPYRLTLDYFRWASYRSGASFARIHYKQWGRVKMVLPCVAKIGQALLVNSPRLLCGYLLGDDVEVLGRKCLLWRAVGYTRETLFLLAPRLFPQKRFFALLEFRRERASFEES